MEASMGCGSDLTSTRANSIRSLGFSDFKRLLLGVNDSSNDSFILAPTTREISTDTTALICLLQSVGFQLKKFDRVSNRGDSKKSTSGFVRVTIECESSGMRADLEARNSQCTCPKENTNASLWNISGTGKLLSVSCANQLADEKFLESGSNLLPPLDKDAVSTLGDVMRQLISLVNSYGKPESQDGDFRDQDGGRDSKASSLGLTEIFDTSFYDQDNSQESFMSSSMTRCHTQPEICPRDQISDRRFSLNYQPRILATQPLEDKPEFPFMRQSTFEFKDIHGEPRSSPPKISSSPVTVCSSLAQVSLESNEEESQGLRLETCLNKACFYIEKARRMYCTKYINDECSPIEFDTSPRDDVFLKPRQPPPNSSQQRASPVTVRKKPPSPGANPSLAKFQANPRFRRSFSGSGSTLRPPNSVSTILKSFLERKEEEELNPAPKLPVRASSIGTPSAGQKVALDAAKKRASVASASARPASTVSRTRVLPKAFAGVGSKIIPAGIRPLSYRTTPPTSSIGTTEEGRKNIYSLGLEKSRLKKNISPESGEKDPKNSKHTPVKDSGRKSYTYSGLKK